jgi:hypothetical protein
MHHENQSLIGFITSFIFFALGNISTNLFLSDIAFIMTILVAFVTLANHYDKTLGSYNRFVRWVKSKFRF